MSKRHELIIDMYAQRNIKWILSIWNTNNQTWEIKQMGISFTEQYISKYFKMRITSDRKNVIK